MNPIMFRAAANAMNNSLVDDAMLLNAKALMQQQDYDRAIGMLDALCRVQPVQEAEALLAECRFRACVANPPSSSGEDPWMMALPDPFGNVVGVPEITADQLDAGTLAAGIRRHGALLVRGLLTRPVAMNLASGVDRSLDECEAWHRNGEGSFTSPWYDRLPLPDDCELAPARLWVEAAGGVWAADSPRLLRELLDLFESSGVVAAITGYFGERPVLSVGKTTLRRVPATIRVADWHQDGAFMGSDIRSLNAWISLSHCGVDASGLEFLPKRLSGILPTGSHGANFKWSVGPGLVDESAAGLGTVSPTFAPGDALLFDHFFLHRTGIPPGISKDRHAIESWFFAPSAYPADQVPLKI